MADKIKLPPLPDTGGWPQSHAQLRARDIEVARVVLEAATLIAGKYGNGAYMIADAIRALEVTHHD